MEELLRVSDIVTVHVDGREENRARRGAGIRGDEGRCDLPQPEPRFVVDVGALARNVRGGKVRGAAVDVFPEEPGATRTLLLAAAGATERDPDPHVGGSTEEAQQGIGDSWRRGSSNTCRRGAPPRA